MPTTSSWLGSLLLLLASPLVATAGPPPTFWVGAAAPCNFNSLQTAIGAVPDGSIVRIASNQSYDDINVTISDQSITLEGGYADCTGTPGDAYVTLTGSAVTAAPVIGVSSPVVAREVTLRRLRIEGGQGSGIELSGHVSLSLERSIVDANVAAHGGGIDVVGVSPDETGIDIVESIIGNLDDAAGTGNEAEEAGGGLFCQNASIHLKGAVIRNNHSTGSGGGGYLNGCVVDTGFNIFYTPELGTVTALIGANAADLVGGGVYAAGGSSLALGPASARLEISDNAAERGGGLYMAGSGTLLEGEGLAIDGNRAIDNGGAAYIEDAAYLSMKRNSNLLAARGAGEDGVGVIVTSCDAPVECSSVSFNRTDTLTGGAFFVAGAALSLDQTVLRGNYSANGSVLLVSAGSVARVQNSLIAENDAHQNDLVRVLDGSSLAMNESTIVGNATGSVLLRLFSDNGANHLALINSIVWEPGTTVLAATPVDTVSSVCVNAHETESIVAVDHAPGFVDEAAGDYRLLASSANIDACADPFGVPTVDILGRLRPADLGGDQGTGIFDRGAYELPDLIFADGFEVPF